MLDSVAISANFNHEKNYNTKIKVAGNNVEFRRYAKTMKTLLKGAEGKKPIRFDDVVAEKTEAEIEYKYYANLRQTRQRVYDLISANVRNNVDHLGRHQRIKFMTLTFGDEIMIESLEWAWVELQNFLKRLSYELFGVKKNVIKYVCTWELQSSGRVHFHLLVFNMPYVSNKASEGYPLQKIWGNGFVGINSLKRKNGKNIDLDKIAGYIVKYMTKTTKRVGDRFVLETDETKNVYTYENYKKHGLENAKKYTASRGLNKPEVYKLLMDQEQFKTFIANVKAQKAFKKNREGNYIKAKAIDCAMNIGGFKTVFNRIWVAQATLRADFIESMQIINLFHAHKHSGIRKIAFIDHALKALDNSFEYKMMREYRAVLI